MAMIKCNKEEIQPPIKKEYASHYKHFKKFWTKSYKNNLSSVTNDYLEYVNNSDLKPNTKHKNLFAIKYALKSSLYRIGRAKDFEALQPIFKFHYKKKPDKIYFTPDIPTPRECAKMMRLSPLKTELIIDFIIHTGVRVSELCNIKLTDIESINIGKRKISSIKYANTKNGTTRFNYYPGSKILRIKQVFGPKEYLFEKKNGKKMHRNDIEKMVRDAGLRINKRVTPHLLRHFFITQKSLNNNLASIYALSSYVGNSPKTLLSIYISHEIKINNSFQDIEKKIKYENKKFRRKRA